MRVLVITNDLPPRIGGIQYYVDQLCRGLATAGDEVLVFGSTSDGAPEWDAGAPYEVVRLRTPVMLPGPYTTARALGLVRRHRPDVVVFGAAFPLALMGPIIRKRTGTPFVAFTHGLEVTSRRAPGGSLPLRLIGRSAAAVTFVSHWCDSELRPAFGDGPRYDLLPPAVDPDAFHPGVDGRAVRERLGLGTAPTIVCVSRLVERKGQDTLIRVLPEVRRRVPDTRLVIVGDGPHRETLERQARERHVDDAVVFTGKVSDDELPSHYAAADVFAMLCRERRGGLEVEAFGIVFIQAQAVGVPVVAGNIGGVADSLRDGTTGHLVDSTDDADVVRALVDVLGDEARRRQMGSAGADLIARSYTWPERSRQLRGLLESVSEAR